MKRVPLYLLFELTTKHVCRAYESQRKLIQLTKASLSCIPQVKYKYIYIYIHIYVKAQVYKTCGSTKSWMLEDRTWGWHKFKRGEERMRLRQSYREGGNCGEIAILLELSHTIIQLKRQAVYLLLLWMKALLHAELFCCCICKAIPSPSTYDPTPAWQSHLFILFFSLLYYISFFLIVFYLVI